MSYNGTVTYRYTYTGDGNVETVTDVANDIVYRYRYDSSGNVIGFSKLEDSEETLNVSNWTSTDGFTTGSSLTFGGTTYTSSSTTDSQSGNVLTFTYDSLSELLTRKNGLFQQSYTYNTVTTSSGDTETTGQIQKIDYAKDTSGSFSGFSLCYEYDLLGNITKVTDGTNVLAQYTYDAQGQLLTETLPQQDTRYEYTYDTAGNLLTTKTYTATGTTATHTDTYTYGDSSWNDLLTAFNGSSITYDGAGNPLTYDNGSAWTFTWSKGRELATASSGGTTLSFTYDADGIRDSKTVNGTPHSYVTLDGTIYQEAWGSNILNFAYDESGRPYSVTYNGTTYYYVLNQQGDVIRIINASGVTQASYTYDAWGNLIASTGTSSGIGAVNPLLYRGYYYDAELGMYYLQSRYYDPVVRRFVNADGIANIGSSATFLSYNLFSYCENNPVNYCDFDGEVAVRAFLKGIIGAAYSIFTSYLVYRVKAFLKNTTFNIKNYRWELIRAGMKGFVSSALSALKARAICTVISNAFFNTKSEIDSVTKNMAAKKIELNIRYVLKTVIKIGINTMLDTVEDYLQSALHSSFNISVFSGGMRIFAYAVRSSLKLSYTSMSSILGEVFSHVVNCC